MPADIETMLSRTLIDRVTSWSSSSLKVSDAEFDAIAGRLYDFDLSGMIEIVGTRKEDYSGKRHYTAVMFRRRE